VFAFGGAIFCCSRRGANGVFLAPEKIFYGLLPMFVSAIALGYTIRLWSRVFLRRRNTWLVGCIVAALAAAADLALFLSDRHSQDDRIKLVWNGDSGFFGWGVGEVKLPPGFTHQPAHGIDTFVGSFSSPDGSTGIEYDIGYL